MVRCDGKSNNHCRCCRYRNNPKPKRCKCKNHKMTQQQSIRSSRLPTITSRPPTLTQQQIQQQQQRSRLPQSVARTRNMQQASPAPSRQVPQSQLPCRTPGQRMAEKSRGGAGVTSDGSALPRPGSAPANRRMCSARSGPCECAPSVDGTGGGGRPMSAGSGLRSPQSSSARGSRPLSRGAGSLSSRCHPSCNSSICEVRAVASGSSITAEATIRRPKSRSQTVPMKQSSLRSRSVASSGTRGTSASGYSGVNSVGNSAYGTPTSVPSEVYPLPSSMGINAYEGNSSSTYGATTVGSSAYDSAGTTTSVGSGYGVPSGGTGYAHSVGASNNKPAGSAGPNVYSVPNSGGGGGTLYPNSVPGSGQSTVTVDGNSYANQENVPDNVYANPNSIGGYSGPTSATSSAYLPNRDTPGNMYGSTPMGGGTFVGPGGTVTNGVGPPGSVGNAGTQFASSIGPHGTSRVTSSGRVPAGNAESAVSFGGVSVHGNSVRQPGVNVAASTTTFSATSGFSGVGSHVGSSSGVGLSSGPGRPLSSGGRSTGVTSTGPSSTFANRESSYATRANCLSALGAMGGSQTPTRGRSVGDLNCPTSCTAALARLGLRAGAEAGARAVAQAVARAVANVDSDAAAFAAAKIASRISPTKQRMLGETNVLGDDPTGYLSPGYNPSLHPSMQNPMQNTTPHRGTRYPSGRYSPTMLRLQETPNASSTVADVPPWEEDIDLADALAALDIVPSSTTNSRWGSPTSQRLFRRSDAASRGAQGARSLGEVPHARTPHSSLASHVGQILDTEPPWELDPDLAMDLDLGDPPHDAPLLASVSAFEPRSHTVRMNPHPNQPTKRIEFQDLDDVTPPWDDFEGAEESEFCGDPLCEAGVALSSRSYTLPRRDQQHKVYPKTPLPSTMFSSTLTGPSAMPSKGDESGIFRPFVNGTRMGATTPAASINQGAGVGGSMTSETGMGGQRMSESMVVGSGAAGSRIRESGLASPGLGSKVQETGTAGSRTRESGLLAPMRTPSRGGENGLGSGVPNDEITNVTMSSTTHQSTLRSPSQALAAMAENLRRQEKHEYETLNKSLREMQQWRRELISDFQMASLAKFTKSELEMIDKVEAPSEVTDGSMMDDTFEEDEMTSNVDAGSTAPQRDPMEEPDLIQFSPPGTLDLSSDAVNPVLSVFSRGILHQLNLI